MSRGGLVVRVDPDVCVGNAMCRAAAPHVFIADDNGQSIAVDSGADPPEQILEAAESCPVGAITVASGDSGEVLFSA